MLLRILPLALALAGCRDSIEETIALTPDDLIERGWAEDHFERELWNEPMVYRITIEAGGRDFELAGGSSSEFWLNPDGEQETRYWREWQSMLTSSDELTLIAHASIRQPIVGCVRRDSSSTVEVDVRFDPSSRSWRSPSSSVEEVRWQQSVLVNLLQPQELSGNGIKLRIERRTP